MDDFDVVKIVPVGRREFGVVRGERMVAICTNRDDAEMVAGGLRASDMLPELYAQIYSLQDKLDELCLAAG